MTPAWPLVCGCLEEARDRWSGTGPDTKPAWRNTVREALEVLVRL
ncbi:hypothetical protein [Streptomyces sp. HB132]|nr:hypothetical protein [Streptomyces sp. HB132]MBM7440522.1 hypothetical protein [Streptomyces sp. HB132]